MNKTPSSWAGWSGGLLTAFAVSLPVSIGLAQFFGLAAVAAWGYGSWRERNGSFVHDRMFFAVVVFTAVAVLASVAGLRPLHSIGKCHRLLFLLLLFAVPAAAQRHPAGPVAFVDRLLLAFLFGTCLLGLYDAVRIPLGALRGDWLFGLGNMRDPQFYMTALLLLVAAARTGRVRRHPAWFAVALLLVAAGLLLHFKRGVWISSAVALILMGLLARWWKPVLILAAVAALLAFAPPVRQRVEALRSEWTTMRGGRMDLWTRVAPGIIREHPWGIGLCATRNEDLRAYGPVAEAKLNHLHNNLLQVTLELGWVGLAAWGYLVLRAGWLMSRAWRRWRGVEPAGSLALGILAAFAGLMANGMVEYNFGDSEIYMLLLLLIGGAAALYPDRARYDGGQPAA